MFSPFRKELYKSLIYFNSPFRNMINFIKVFLCAAIINFSQCPGKTIKGRVVSTEGGAVLCGKKMDCYKGNHITRDVTHLIPMGETVLLRWESRFVFIVVWESTGPWIIHLVLLEKASWLEGQLANCSKRVKWHPIRGSVQNRCSLIEKAAGAR